ncbi:hypothetical protein [Ornithinibacillus sp. JPR2-1]|uniref:hypothetical protein n=1 Tax=Ornithinibacillus sp. JPR2-1 TaxID=2094019 RepID=UPI0031DDDE4F
MEKFNGTVFHGELEQNSFYLTQVKNISTASTLSLEQLVKMASYLDRQNDSCYITVNDQVPILLNDVDMKNLQRDLEVILQQIH